MSRIVVVDDEESIRELIKFNLEKAGYQVECLADGSEALQYLGEHPPDLVVLDIMLPSMDGLDVCRILRQREKTRCLPVIMLTARTEEIDRVVGLEIGADDYLTKPFSPRELLARIKAVLRRTKNDQGEKEDRHRQDNVIVRNDLVIYPERYEARLAGRTLELTPKEFQLLLQLASNPCKVYTREFLLEKIWGYEFAGDTRTVDVHIRHLRRKLEKDPSRPVLLETIRGVGYRFRS